MQHYKGLFLLVLCVGFWTISQAQLRVFAGPQLTTAKYTVRNVKQETEFKNGFLAGVGLTSQVEGPLYFVPSLYYSQKGYKVAYNLPAVLPNEDARNNDVTVRSLALTPLLQINFSDNDENHLFVRVGPGIEIALSGNETFDSAGVKTIDRSMSFSPLMYSPASAFFNLQLGYELKSGLSLLAHYEHGLSSLNNADRGPMILQRAIGLTVGWRFRND